MNRQAMRGFVVKNCLLAGETTLSGGGTAGFYFDCKRATLHGDFLLALSDWIVNEVAAALAPPATVIGGPTIGADFIAAAAVMRAAQLGLPLTAAAIVRKEPKKHGTKNKIENEPEAPARILIVEDVITTGGSIAQACDEFIAAGHQIAAIAAIIDRQAGGKEALAQKYRVPVVALFCRDDFGDLA